MGADVIINSSEADVFKTVMAATEGQGAEKVFETAGSEATIALTPFHRSIVTGC